MIDLHTHLLPRIDDGACDVETALKMTEALYAQNIMVAVCTPHFNPTDTTLEDFVARRASAFAQMGVSQLHLIPASETILHEYLFHYPDLSRLCIENTRYLLLEFHDQKKWASKNYEYLEKLINHYNIIPIIAHIERYPAVKRKHIKKLMELGCVIQLNTSAILNPKTRKKAFQYIKHNYIDVLGSDCHDLQKRPPNMVGAIDIIKEKFGIQYCEKLEDQTSCIINGIELRKKKSYIIE